MLQNAVAHTLLGLFFFGGGSPVVIGSVLFKDDPH